MLDFCQHLLPRSGCSPQDSHPNGLCCCKVLEVLKQIGAFDFVMFSRPVIVEYLYLAAVLVYEASEKPGLPQRFATIEYVFEHCLFKMSENPMSRWVPGEQTILGYATGTLESTSRCLVSPRTISRWHRSQIKSHVCSLSISSL